LVGNPDVEQAGLFLEIALQKGLALGDRMGAIDAVRRLQQTSQDYYLLKHARAMLQDVVGSEIWTPLQEPQPGSAIGSSGTASAPTLEQNYPNPLNPRTTFAFSLPVAGRARLNIFDVRGRLVRTLVDGQFPAGRHEVIWDGTNANGGK